MELNLELNLPIVDCISRDCTNENFNSSVVLCDASIIPDLQDFNSGSLCTNVVFGDETQAWCGENDCKGAIFHEGSSCEGYGCPMEEEEFIEQMAQYIEFLENELEKCKWANTPKKVNCNTKKNKRVCKNWGGSCRWYGNKKRGSCKPR